MRNALRSFHCSSRTLVAGNLDRNPDFADPDGADDDPQPFGDNDYTLALLSPCIDAADRP